MIATSTKMKDLENGEQVKEKRLEAICELNDSRQKQKKIDLNLELKDTLIAQLRLENEVLKTRCLDVENDFKSRQIEREEIAYKMETEICHQITVCLLLIPTSYLDALLGE